MDKRIPDTRVTYTHLSRRVYKRGHVITRVLGIYNYTYAEFIKISGDFIIFRLSRLHASTVKVYLYKLTGDLFRSPGYARCTFPGSTYIIQCTFLNKIENKVNIQFIMWEGALLHHVCIVYNPTVFKMGSLIRIGYLFYTVFCWMRVSLGRHF